MTDTKKRERLAALAVGGQAKQYLGQNFTADQVDSMTNEEVDKLHAQYEARPGAAMTKTLGMAALQLYAATASMLLPIPPENQPKLVTDLEADPFVEHALSSATCELYHLYGMYLAPLTAALTTARHCQFKHGLQQIHVGTTNSETATEDVGTGTIGTTTCRGGEVDSN